MDAEQVENSGAYLVEKQFDTSALVWTEKGSQKVELAPSRGQRRGQATRITGGLHSPL